MLAGWLRASFLQTWKLKEKDRSKTEVQPTKGIDGWSDVANTDFFSWSSLVNDFLIDGQISSFYPDQPDNATQTHSIIVKILENTF